VACRFLGASTRVIWSKLRTFSASFRTSFEPRQRLQLYDGQSQGIKIGAYEAHPLGNIDENILWRGSKEVLKLAEKLRNFDQITRVLVKFCYERTKQRC
jgi:hypothetical protein